MEQELVSRSHIQTLDHISDWREAIKLAATPLLDDGCIQESYVEAMIRTVLELGTYIVLMPMVALPHARSDGRVNRDGMAVLKLKEPVYFDEGDESSKAALILPIACTDDDGHLAMLGKVAEILGDEEIMARVLASNDSEELYHILNTLPEHE